MKVENIDDLRVKAEYYVETGDHVQVEKLYRELLIHDEKDVDAHYMIGVLLAEKIDVLDLGCGTGLCAPSWRI